MKRPHEPSVRNNVLTPRGFQVCKYFHYKIRYQNSTHDIPDFPIEPQIALDLLMAANFLDT
jgi:hypothetical protein